jgi:hypothetical protein
VKSRDEIERELCRAILSSAQSEADEGRGFMCPPEALSDLRSPERATVDVARRAVGVNDRIWEQELHRHVVVHDIVSGTRKNHRSAS